MSVRKELPIQARRTSVPGDGSWAAAMKEQSPALAVEGVTKCYNGVVAVKGLTFTVQPGELMVLVGPSGCGKTTVLRLIAGLEHPDEGRVILAGQCVSEGKSVVPPEHRRVSLMFQDYALFPHLTVAENVAFGLKRWPRARREERVREMLEMVSLSHLATRYPHELSGGEQQRVALARALAPNPRLLLLDEPFSNLDITLRVQMREEIRDLLKALHITALFVTHDQEEALFMGDRLAVLHRGRLEQIGPPEEIYHRPATRFVATFFGPTSFIRATVTPNGLHTELGFLPQRMSASVGSEVDVLIRPDDVELVPDEKGTARVVKRRFLGMHHLYDVLLPSGRTLSGMSRHVHAYPVGMRVRVVLRPGHELRWFPVDGK